MLILLFVALWFILRRDLFYVLPCVILFLFFFVVVFFFSPFSIAITSLGEERANLSAFRTFVRLVLVWFCRFSLPFDIWEGLRFVILLPFSVHLSLFVCNYSWRCWQAIFCECGSSDNLLQWNLSGRISSLQCTSVHTFDLRHATRAVIEYASSKSASEGKLQPKNY